MLTSLPNHRQIFTPKCKQENLHIQLSHLINLKTPKKQSNLLNWSNTGQKGKLKLLMLDAEKCIWQKLYCLRLSFDYFFQIIIRQNSKSEPVIRLYCTQLESSSKTKLQCSLIVYIIILVLCIKNKNKTEIWGWGRGRGQ